MESDILASFSTTYEFKRPIVFKRYPDIIQNFVFQVVETQSNKVLGKAKIVLNSPYTEREFQASLPIYDDQDSEIGSLQAVFSKCAKNSREFVGLEIIGKSLINVDGEGDKSDPFLIFHRHCQNDIYVPVYCTTALLDTLNPKWDKVVLGVEQLCEKDPNSPIKIECWDWQEDLRYQFMGDVKTSLTELRSKPVLQLRGRDGKSKTGELVIKACTKLVKPSPIDFLTAKDTFSFTLGIDFSEYNKKPYNKRNLHELDKRGSSSYLKAIEEIARIIWSQDTDGKIPCFGFGGRPSFPDFTFSTSHSLIPLSGHKNKMSITSPKHLVESYLKAIDFIEPTKPACINDILKMVKDWATRDINDGVYQVLIILTAGHIDDVKGSIDTLVDIASLPISIVLVGIGDNDFSTLEKLDGDKKWLRNSKKKLTSRDIVNFVDFEESCGNLDKFGRRLLEEFPEQFMSYKLLTGQKADKDVK